MTLAPRSRHAAPPVQGIDALRGACVLMVVVGHSMDFWPESPWGPLFLPVSYAIVAWFVLTGYIVTEVLVREFDDAGTVDLTGFWRRKLLRTFPTLFVFVLFIFAWQRLAGLDAPLLRLAANWTFLGNYYNGLALGDDYRHNVGHLWSIAVGFHFLVLFVWALRWALIRGKVGALSQWLLGAVGMTFLLHWVLFWGATHDQSWAPLQVYVYNATETRIGEIALGAWLALVVRQQGEDGPLSRLGAHPVAPLMAAAVGVGALFVPQSAYAFSLYAVVSALVVLVITRTPSRALRVPAQWLAAASVISYSLFVWHRVGFGVHDRLMFLPAPVRIPAVLVAVGAGAFIAFLIFERPFRHKAVTATQGGAAQ